MDSSGVFGSFHKFPYAATDSHRGPIPCAVDFWSSLAIMSYMNKNELKAIGENLYPGRWQTKLAADLGISLRQMARYAAGETSIPAPTARLLVMSAFMALSTDGEAQAPDLLKLFAAGMSEAEAEANLRRLLSRLGEIQ